jgi:hypothetical protein
MAASHEPEKEALAIRADLTAMGGTKKTDFLVCHPIIRRLTQSLRRKLGLDYDAGRHGTACRA